MNFITSVLHAASFGTVKTIPSTLFRQSLAIYIQFTIATHYIFPKPSTVYLFIILPDWSSWPANILQRVGLGFLQVGNIFLEN